MQKGRKIVRDVKNVSIKECKDHAPEKRMLELKEQQRDLILFMENKVHRTERNYSTIFSKPLGEMRW